MTSALAIVTVAFGFLSAWLTNRSAVWSRIAKIVASTAMVTIVFTGGSSFDAYSVLVTAALVASWWGDLALSFTGTRAFLVGLISFALAHLLYVAGFFSRSSMDLLAVAVSTVVMALTAASILRWLAPHTPERLRGPVAAYVAIISIMVVAAFGTSGTLPDPRIPTAAVLFTASDVLVARQQFVEPALVNRIIGLPLYYTAQALFAITVVWPWV